MERDMDLIRELLIYFAEKPDPRPVRPEDIKLDGWNDARLIKYHCLLLFQAGFLDAEVATADGSGRPMLVVIAFSLTWQGHEFLAPIRDPAVWRHVKAATNQLGATTLESVRSVIRSLIARGLEAAVSAVFTG